MISSTIERKRQSDSGEGSNCWASLPKSRAETVNRGDRQVRDGRWEGEKGGEGGVDTIIGIDEGGGVEEVEFPPAGVALI